MEFKLIKGTAKLRIYGCTINNLTNTITKDFVSYKFF